MQPQGQTLHAILRAGVLAPSADNRHRLRFDVADGVVHLVGTDVSTWPGQPHRQMLALLALGAVIENMALRSAQFGLAMKVTHWPACQQLDCVAELHWEASTLHADPLALAIESRHTNRRFYQRSALPPSTINALSTAAASSPGAQVRWLDTGRTRTLALRALRIAETERFRRQSLHQELFEAVRFDVGWQDSAEEGLPPATLQIERPMRGPFSLLRRWPLMRAACGLGAHHLLGLRAAYFPCAVAPHIGLMLAGATSERLAAVQAGRSFQRLWLAAAQAGLALQPMAAATALVRQAPGAGWVSAESKAELARVLHLLCPEPQLHAYLLFRLGRAQPPAAMTTRPALEHYLG